VFLLRVLDRTFAEAKIDYSLWEYSVKALWPSDEARAQWSDWILEYGEHEAEEKESDYLRGCKMWRR
jgi:hypothetical protein